jgi:hypothetical protein
MSTTATTATTEADARNRALRSFLWGLIIDVSVAILLVLSVTITDLRWTREYWVALGLSLLKSVAQAAVAYVARKLLPPRLSSVISGSPQARRT